MQYQLRLRYMIIDDDTMFARVATQEIHSSFQPSDRLAVPKLLSHSLTKPNYSSNSMI